MLGRYKLILRKIDIFSNKFIGFFLLLIEIFDAADLSSAESPYDVIVKMCSELHWAAQ